MMAGWRVTQSASSVYLFGFLQSGTVGGEGVGSFTMVSDKPLKALHGYESQCFRVRANGDSGWNQEASLEQV